MAGSPAAIGLVMADTAMKAASVQARPLYDAQSAPAIPTSDLANSPAPPDAAKGLDYFPPARPGASRSREAIQIPEHPCSMKFS